MIQEDSQVEVDTTYSLFPPYFSTKFFGTTY